MILNLLNTIAIAFSIGTSANNTNFNYEKKSHRNAVTTYTDHATYENVGINIYGVDHVNGGHEITANKYKYAIDGNYNYSNSIGVLNNTTYSMYGQSTDVNYGFNIARLIQIIKINNYRDVGVNISLNTTLPIEYTTNLITNIWVYGGFDLDLDQYLGLTNYNLQTLIDIKEIADDYTELYRESWIPQYTDPVTADIGTGSISMPANSTYTIMWSMEYTTTDTNNPIQHQIEPTDYWLTATWEQEYINQEVVDVPGLMFTVLTLPFSFISQAFNLTVFPGTPYQINFSNLFLTVIAIFILLWLIKHIFK